MTQKDKLQFALITMKQVADSLRRDAKDFDCTFPLTHATRLDSAVKLCMSKSRKAKIRSSY